MEIDATCLRHEDSTVSVVSCLPISRGTVAVAESVRSGGKSVYLPAYLYVITMVGNFLLTSTTLKVPGSALGEAQSHRQGGLSGWMCW